MNKKYVFIGKTLFFPKEKILVVGDLHLGYSEMLRQKGLEISIRQFEEMQEELEKTIKYAKAIYGKIEKIVFLGDVKHHFGYLETEREEIKKLLSFLRKWGVDENRVIFVRGNHEKNEKSGKYCDFYIVKDIAFIHGHRDFLEIYDTENKQRKLFSVSKNSNKFSDKKINLIVMGHLHPTVTLSDKMKIKREKYKCFLVGRYKKKDFVVVPSFISITEGVSLSEFIDEKGYDYSIVPNKELENFEVYAINEVGEEALAFGKLKDLH